MCPPGYHHNGFVATHALRHMMYGCISCTRTSCAQMHELPQSHCSDNQEGKYCFYDYKYILHPSYFCEIRTLCAVDHL